MYVLQHKAAAFELATFILFLMDLVYPQKDLEALFSLTLGTHVIARDGRVLQSWVKTTQVSAKFEFRSESLRSKFSLIRFVYNLTRGCF